MKGTTMRLLVHGAACLTFAAASLLIVVGCGPTKTEPAKDSKQRGKDGKAEAGPHDGPWADWNDKYKTEVTVDSSKKEATVYIFDSKGAKAAPIDAKTAVKLTLTKPAAATIDLKASPDTGDPEGKASRFVGIHDKLAEQGPYVGEVSAKVGDKEYSGKFDSTKVKAAD
jgi:hypothetical protein